MMKWRVRKFTYKHGSFHKVPSFEAFDKRERNMDILIVLEKNGESFLNQYIIWLEKRDEYNR